jgi:hypothetical protein
MLRGSQRFAFMSLCILFKVTRFRVRFYVRLKCNYLSDNIASVFPEKVITILSGRQNGGTE